MNDDIVLRPFTRDEYHSFYQRYEPDPIMDPRPYRYQFTHTDKSFDYDLSRREESPVFGIFVHNEAVGALSLNRINHEKHQCEIGLTLVNDQCKNKGYGTKAMILGMEKAVHEYSIQHIYAETMGNNSPMRHILEKLHFKLIERIPEIYNMSTGKQDRLIFQWEACNEKDSDRNK